MKCAVLPGLLALLCGAMSAPAPPSSSELRPEARSIGPLRDFHPIESLQESIAAFLQPAEAKPATSHQLISLSEFPVWRVHHYNGMELKPVTEAELAQPLPAGAYPAPSTEFVADAHKPAETYGSPEVGSLSALEGLSGGLAALSGIREAISSLRASVASLPQLLLSTIGLGGTTSEETTAYSAPSQGLPALPDLHQLIQLPASVLSHLPSLPSLPFQLPQLAGNNDKDKKPTVYVVVNKPAKEEAPATYGVPSIETVSPYDAPKEPVTSYNEPKFVPPVYEEPPFELPTSYDTPKKYPSKAYGAPLGLVPPLTLARPLQTSNLKDLHALAVAGNNALSNFETASEAVDAINSLNEINSIGSIADSRDGGFKPSQGMATNRLSYASMRSDEVPPQHNGHVAASTPTRASAPSFKGSQSDPVIVMPTQQKQ